MCGRLPGKYREQERKREAFEREGEKCEGNPTPARGKDRPIPAAPTDPRGKPGGWRKNPPEGRRWEADWPPDEKESVADKATIPHAGERNSAERTSLNDGRRPKRSVYSCPEN